MSWSISASGSKEQVHKRIDEAVDPSRASPDQKVEWERARQALHLLVDSQSTNHASVSGNGSASGSISISISGWNEEVKTEPVVVA